MKEVRGKESMEEEKKCFKAFAPAAPNISNLSFNSSQKELDWAAGATSIQQD